MKQILLFSLLLFATSNNFAQITIEENKVWTVLSQGFGPDYHTFAIKFSGDTTINNIVYKKMLSSADSSLANSWGQSNIFMREDSLHRIYKYNENEEQLLYDFSLEVGDTFEVHFYQYPCILLA